MYYIFNLQNINHDVSSKVHGCTFVHNLSIDFEIVVSEEHD